jgi:hypothetical protein
MVRRVWKERPGTKCSSILAILSLTTLPLTAQKMAPWLTRSADNGRSGGNGGNAQETKLTQASVGTEGSIRFTTIPVFGDALARGSMPSLPSRQQRAPLLHAEQIDVEYQRGARRDDATGAARAIAQVRRNDQRALAADMRGGDAFVPALDDLALAEREGKRLAPVE